jgi:hypothetical protein
MASSQGTEKNWQKNWQTWWENCAVPENIQFSFSCSFFTQINLHSLTESVWGPYNVTLRRVGMTIIVVEKP